MVTEDCTDPDNDYGLPGAIFFCAVHPFTITPSTLTFTGGTVAWNAAQTITVMAPDNPRCGDEHARIAVRLTGTGHFRTNSVYYYGDEPAPEEGFSSATAKYVNVTVKDNDGNTCDPPESQDTTSEEETQQQKRHAKDSALELTGTNGPDELSGGGGNDLLVGKKGDDVLRGLGGNDELRGGRGADELRGGQGADKLWGGRGNDRLYGDRGADRLEGGNGDDTYTGGPGADRFVFLSNETGDKIITDFGDGDDRIVLKTERNPWPSVADIIAGVVADGDRYYVYTLLDGLTVETDTPLDTGDFQVK